MYVFHVSSPLATTSMRTILLIIGLVGSAMGDIMAGLGTALSVGTGLLPPEMRGMAGTLANAALAKQNKEKGVIEVVQDGSDYPFICICPTATQIKEVKATTGVTIAADKCAEDQKMGCKPAQVNMDSVPLPQVKTTTK